MRLSALLSPGSVPLDADATVSVLLDITAPGRAEDGLLAGAARAVSLRVPVGPRLNGARVVGGTPSRRLPDGSLAVELGDFRSGESRRLLLRLEVPGLSCPGPATVTALEAAYTDPATLAAHTAVLPVTVDVVPGGRASPRALRPEIRAGEPLRRARSTGRGTGEALRRGDRDTAADGLHRARRDLVGPAGPAGHGAPPPPGAGAQPETETQPGTPPPGAEARSDGPEATAGRTRAGDASRTAAPLGAGRPGRTRERGRDGAPPREGVIRGEQTDRGRPTPDRAPPAPGGGGRRGSGTPRDPGPPPDR
ncbi:hypothetical protein [Nocardiopsis sp. CA-288880]|uniref:hypothetical protein n=1 Tax=Nocardiopsis sp. CA-288880 TaxID=3239995 RepID=UPI003D955372